MKNESFKFEEHSVQKSNVDDKNKEIDSHPCVIDQNESTTASAP